MVVLQKKLLFISHTSDLSGGGEKSLLEVILSCRESGYLCHVILPGTGAFQARLDEVRIPHTEIAYPWSEYKADDGQDPLREEHVALHIANCMSGIEGVTLAFEPDVVITNTIVVPWGMYVAKALGIPNIVMVREWMFGEDEMRMAPENGQYIKMTGAYADWILFNSQDMLEKYQEYFPHMPMSLMYPDVGISEEVIRTRYRERPTGAGLSILVAGTFIAHKNQIEAVRGVRRAVEMGVPVEKTLLIGKVGDPDYYAALKAEIAESAESEPDGLFEIRAFADDFIEVLNQYGVVVVPSKSEPFGRVTLEAQLFGRVVIGSRSGGTPELIADMETGLLYEAGNADDLAESIKWVHDHPAEASEVAERAMTSQRERFVSADRMTPFFAAVESVSEKYASIWRDRAFDPLFIAVIKRKSLEKEITEIMDSKAFRLGHTLLTPFKKIKKAFERGSTI